MTEMQKNGKRRSHGDGGVHWDQKRQRWIATAALGYDPSGKRIIRKTSAKTKSEAIRKVKEILRDHEDGLKSGPVNYTVKDAVTYWLEFGLSRRAETTRENYWHIARSHIIPTLGARKLKDLSGEDVDRWLRREAKAVSTRTLRLAHSILNRAVRYAQARDKVKRNVVSLCDIPEGKKPGRPSKSLTFDQAEAVLEAAPGSSLYAYIVLSLLTGARTEELRGLKWKGVDLQGDPEAVPPIPPSVSVLRSHRTGGDTKTKRSRRRLALPVRCIDALKSHHDRTPQPDPEDFVFASRNGTELDSHNVRRAFRLVVEKAGLPAKDWTPREMRHTFASLLSDSGIPIEVISRLMGHSGTTVTETVYRKQIRPVMQDGATAMDGIFAWPEDPKKTAEQQQGRPTCPQ